MTIPDSKILVVDDDHEVVEIVSDILVNNNFEIFGAFNGVQALEVIKQETPDIIIMDWEMPVKDGIETLKLLKQIPVIQNIPVIMITGRMTSMEDLKEAFEAGAIDFIRKPIEPVELIARTKSMLLLSKYFKESIRKKDWELTLLSKTNHQNDELMTSIISVVDELFENCKLVDSLKFDEIRNKIQQIKGNIKNNSWEQFQDYFKRVHPNFADNLLKAFPKISSEELRLCYFLRLNMSSKEIALITNKEMQSIDVARYRLRKKLQLKRDVKLHEFLFNF